jgi:ATP-dependent helicase/nuclease subunit A
MMSEKIFTLYRSSAGSGKTRTLAKEYLKLALQFRAGYFRHILAVTFTNKATQEMKGRILHYLHAFVNGEEQGLARELKEELKLDDQSFLQQCHEIRNLILHQYSQFAITTIDAFFQKVIRSFTREAGLAGDYRLELDQQAVLREVIDQLIRELGKDKNLTRWMIEFSEANMEEDKGWDVRQGLMDFAREIFTEEFKDIAPEVNATTQQREYFEALLKKLRQKQQTFIHFIRQQASEGLTAIQEAGLEQSDFRYGTGFTFFRNLKDLARVKDFEMPGVRTTEDLKDLQNWPQKKSNRHADVLHLTETKLYSLWESILDYREKNVREALSAEVVLENFYAFGLLADISRKLSEYKSGNNIMLLSDANHFLHGLIGESDTPFIYEKVGSFYQHYLIDEFQDTSGMQWKNFYPLVTNSLDSGYKSLVVGDVKQAIYRWRGGNLSLLQQQVEKEIGSERVETKELGSNFRSAAEIVSFNNAFFMEAANRVSQQTGAAMATDVYREQEVMQKISSKEEGFVRIKFLEHDKEDRWKEQAKRNLVAQLEELQLAGVRLKEIAILVRTNREGQEIVTHLLEHQYSAHARPECRYDVISNESLRIDGCASVNVLLAALRYLNNPDDLIARAELVYEYTRLQQAGNITADTFRITDLRAFERKLPKAFTREKVSLRKLPLFELTETLIEIFSLHEHTGELAYVQAFQETVLNFYTRERNDVRAFLEWWEEHAGTDKTSLKTSGEIDAAQILTIHKSKGLQFRYVLIPFCAWSFDHGYWQAPNLWVNSVEGIFEDAGYLPVRYSSKLADTFFHEAYAEEHIHTYLDNLNLMYVAFTRAEKGMIVTAPLPKDKEKSIKDAAALLHICVRSREPLAGKWDEATLSWSSGEVKQAAKVDEKQASNLIELTAYPVSRWRSKLVIRQSGKDYFGVQTHEQEAKKRYGIRVHTVLSRVRYQDELTQALQQAVTEGLLTIHEQVPVLEELNALMEQPLVASWFRREWDVKTEVPVLLPGGEEFRIDRLLISGNRAVVIDFKTGNPAARDEQQVLAYMNLLKQMNFTDVSGYLLYVRSGEVMPVLDAKPKKKKREDENQLGLGL